VPTVSVRPRAGKLTAFFAAPIVHEADGPAPAESRENPEKIGREKKSARPVRSDPVSVLGEMREAPPGTTRAALMLLVAVMPSPPTQVSGPRLETRDFVLGRAVLGEPIIGFSVGRRSTESFLGEPI
jgi:hypothetical protein